MEAALQSGGADSKLRARCVAEGLRSLGGYRLSACLLLEKGVSVCAAVDEAGDPQSALEDPLRALLLQWTESGAPDQPCSASLPSLPADNLVGAIMTYHGRCHGALAVAVPKNAPAGQEASTAALLAQCAQRLALLLFLDEERENHDEAELREWYGYVNETTSIVSHEFNNYLNGMMLHLALLQQEAPRQMTVELDVLKRLVTEAANLVKRLQAYNGKRRPSLEAIDLSEAVRDALASRRLPTGVTALNLELAPKLPRVQATRRDLGRLLHLLIKQSAAAMEARPGAIVIRTEVGNRKVVLRFEDQGPPIAADALPRLFEPFFIARPGTEEPGMALSYTLARRMHASMRAENRPEGGVAFVFEFMLAT